MSSPSQPNPQRPSLEDLLRFKRAERPSPEFWAEFDRGLRQKQLAALMKRPQGWARWSPVLGRSLRWAVPATAAAAVALVVVQIPFSTASRDVPVDVASRSAPDVEQSVDASARGPSLATLAAATHSQPSERAPVSVVATTAAPATARETAVASSNETERVLPWSETTFQSDSNFRSATLMLASAPTSSAPKRLRSSWTSRFNEITRELTAEQAADRMLQLASMNMSFSAPTVAAKEGGESYAATTPVARPAAERDFRDLESRFGVTGSSLSIKF